VVFSHKVALSSIDAPFISGKNLHGKTFVSAIPQKRTLPMRVVTIHTLPIKRIDGKFQAPLHMAVGRNSRSVQIAFENTRSTRPPVQSRQPVSPQAYNFFSLSQFSP
jgi:hypothetical protein